MSAERWLAEYVEDGNVAFRIGRVGEDVVAEWIGLVRLTSRRDGTDVRFEVAPGAHSPDVEKIRQGSAQLLLRQLGGELSLHGAAVGRDGHAVVLLGRSGQGKSTLAAHLCRRRGLAFLADDAVAVGRRSDAFVVEPLEANHWIDVDARRALGLPPGDAGKAPIAATRLGPPSMLVAAVELSYAEGPPRLARLAGVDAMQVLVPQVVRFVLDEPDVQRRELAQLATLVGAVPLYRLGRARDLARLDEGAELVESLIRESKVVP
jgi:hypothetical protein